MRLLQHFRSLESIYQLHDLQAQTLVAVTAYFSHLSLESSERGKLATFALNLVAKTFAICTRTIAIQGADCPTDLYRGRLS